MTSLNKEQDLVRPFLRWAGSKRQLVATIMKYLPINVRRYVEPFCGSGTVYFAAKPRRALLSDINPGVINTYRAVRRDPSRVARIYRMWANSEAQYYHIRNIKDSELDNYEKAAKLIYLMRYCYGGLYRTNSSGEFNVPYGGVKTGSLPSEEELVIVSKLLRRVKLRSGDFETILIEEASESDFIYLDPPYAISGDRKRLQYGKGAYNENDLIRTSAVLDHLHNTGSKFALSYSNTKEAVDIFSKWNVEVVSVRRLVASKAVNRRDATEIIVTNFGR